MKEEDYIPRKTAPENPFKVPEGYFEQFTESLMNRLPKQQPRNTSLFKRLRPVWYAAATVCGIVLSTGYLFLRHADSTDIPPYDEPAISIVDESDELTDELLDYAMTDNMEIAYYLTTAD